jgi:hypothetical protein
MDAETGTDFYKSFYHLLFAKPPLRFENMGEVFLLFLQQSPVRARDTDGADKGGLVLARKVGPPAGLEKAALDVADQYRLPVSAIGAIKNHRFILFDIHFYFLYRMF